MVIGSRYVEKTSYKTTVFRKIGMMYFKNLVKNLSHHKDSFLIDEIWPFNLALLKPFLPSYIAGFYIEDYEDSDVDDLLSTKIRSEKTLIKQINNIADSYRGGKTRDINYGFSELNTQIALLPIWFLTIKYNKKTFAYTINGSTGKIAGKLPLGNFSFILLFITLFLLCGAISVIPFLW